MYLYSPVVINLEYVKKEFNKIKLKLSNCTGGEKYFDPIRKIFVAIMPEETVRQKMIRYMQKYMSVPSTNIGIEEHYDVLDRAVFFRIIDNTTVNNMTWLHKWWGHVRLENIAVHDVLPQG